jgi:hypothetical protein
MIYSGVTVLTLLHLSSTPVLSVPERKNHNGIYTPSPDRACPERSEGERELGGEVLRDRD